MDFEGVEVFPDEVQQQLQNEQQIVVQNEKDSIELQLDLQNDGSEFLLTLSPPEKNNKGSRNNLCIVCVIDISGSMDAEAQVVNEKGDKEQYGLSVLDVVKHSVKTILANLCESDSLSIVSYSDLARVELQLCEMSEENKLQANKILDGLRTEGSTNLWDGLQTGLEVLRENYEFGVNQTVFLFTDGMPNVNPPRGHIPMLKKYKETYPDLQVMINTFGFGYSMDSLLLNEIALEGGGFYAYIPDSGMVGTVFVNAIANVMSIYAKNLIIQVSVLEGAKLIQQENEKYFLGGFLEQKASWGVQAEVGFLCYGQKRSFLFKVENQQAVKEKNFLDVTVKYQNLETKKEEKKQKEFGNEKLLFEQAFFHSEKARLILCETILKTWTDFKAGKQKESVEILDSALKQIENFAQQNEQCQYLKNIFTDLKGEIKLGITSPQNFNKWGYHFLPSIRYAHLLQICNNFKDPGVQHYGGQIFKKTRDLIENSFTKIPPPKPSKIPQQQQNNPNYKPKTVNMARFNYAGGGCFSGENYVLMADGTQKKARLVRKGDKVQTNSGKIDTVRCVVNTNCSTQKNIQVVQIGKLIITPYHPVSFEQGNWVFPKDVAEIKNIFVQEVCSFLLEKENSVIVEGIQCVAWGHGIQHPVASHEFFGTQKIVQELSTKVGWKKGFVQLQYNSLVRDPSTQLVVALRQEPLMLSF